MEELAEVGRTRESELGGHVSRALLAVGEQPLGLQQDAAVDELLAVTPSAASVARVSVRAE